MTEPIALTDVQFKDLQIAILQQALTKQQAVGLMQQANAGVAEATKAAGLDSAKTYSLDVASKTVTEVVK